MLHERPVSTHHKSRSHSKGPCATTGIQTRYRLREELLGRGSDWRHGYTRFWEDTPPSAAVWVACVSVNFSLLCLFLLQCSSLCIPQRHQSHQFWWSSTRSGKCRHESTFSLLLPCSVSPRISGCCSRHLYLLDRLEIFSSQLKTFFFVEVNEKKVSFFPSFRISVHPVDWILIFLLNI